MYTFSFVSDAHGEMREDSESTSYGIVRFPYSDLKKICSLRQPNVNASNLCMVHHAQFIITINANNIIV